MPTLEALWRAYRERGLVVIGVSVDRGVPRGLARWRVWRTTPASGAEMRALLETLLPRPR